MNVKCMVGLHKWNGCKCERCCKVRDEGHNWSKDCEICCRCGKKRTADHDWSKDCEICSRCGKSRNGAHVWSTDKMKCTQCRQGYEKTFEKMLRLVEADKLEEFQEIVANGVDLQWRSLDGIDVFLHACQRNRDGRMVTFLLEKGLTPADADKEHYTALHLAVMGNNLRAVEVLLRSGADVNVLMPHWDTPLHVAAFAGSVECGAFLIKQGAHINAANIKGNTPLHFAAQEGRLALVEMLVKNGADHLICNNRGLTPANMTDTTAVTHNPTKIAIGKYLYALGGTPKKVRIPTLEEMEEMGLLGRGLGDIQLSASTKYRAKLRTFLMRSFDFVTESITFETDAACQITAISNPDFFPDMMVGCELLSLTDLERNIHIQ